MKIRRVILLCTMLAVVPLSVEAGPLRDMIKGKQEDIKKTGRVLYDIPYGPSEAQKMDIYLPLMPNNAPIIMMAHGGGWRRGDKEYSRVVENKSKHYTQKGMIFVSINYRMRPEVDPYVQAQDVAAAASYLQNHAAQWGGDPARLVLMGHSAGAHLVALVTANPANPDWGALKPIKGTVVLDSGALDVPEIMERKHHKIYDTAFGEDKNLWVKASPYHQLTAQANPMLLVCSSSRPDKPCAQAEAFAKKAEELGVSMGTLPQDKTHGEINKDLGAPGAYTQEVDSFLQRVLK